MDEKLISEICEDYNLVVENVDYIEREFDEKTVNIPTCYDLGGDSDFGDDAHYHITISEDKERKEYNVEIKFDFDLEGYGYLTIDSVCDLAKAVKEIKEMLEDIKIRLSKSRGWRTK